MDAMDYIGAFIFVYTILGIEGSVVLNHVPLAGATSENIDNLNDAADTTCVDIPQGDQAPWTFKVKMVTVPSGEKVKVVPEGLDCNFQDFFVMVNTTQDESPATAYNKCNMVNADTSVPSKPVCSFDCGTDTADKFTFMQIFNAPVGGKFCKVYYE